VFADRYHSHVLRSPREVANAIRYVLDNHRQHARESLPASWRDPLARARRAAVPLNCSSRAYVSCRDGCFARSSAKGTSSTTAAKRKRNAARARDAPPRGEPPRIESHYRPRRVVDRSKEHVEVVPLQHAQEPVSNSTVSSQPLE
jgi:hypothetical protein